VWGATPDEPHGFSWTWVELVEHLARHWAYVFVEEGDPLGLDAPPELLRAAVDERWGAVAAEQRAEEEELLWAYLQSHDLASAVQGAYPAPLWLTREGNELRIACKDAVVRSPLVNARAVLVALGEAIVLRLRALGDEPRALAAVANWERREAIDPMRLAAIATGLGSAEVEALADVEDLHLTSLEFDTAFKPDEYLAVARMARGALPIDALAMLFDVMRAQPAVWTGPIDKLADGAGEILEGLADKQAFDQGRAVARWLREHLSIQDTERVEPDELLANWKISLVDVRLPSRELDAVSFWGSKHGPAVIVNRNGRHGRMNGLRATLAHEIGHLIMDRKTALPVAEVMGGRVSNRVEMRARAFAASLLMPESIAGKEVVGARDVKELDQTLSRLSGWYGASLELVAWQAYNANDRRLPPMAFRHLRSRGLLRPPGSHVA
jgi:Zn-dependent peptidase ImmA (M78 family)